MKKKETKPETEELTNLIDEQVADLNAVPKKKNKNKLADETSAAPKGKKAASEKSGKVITESKELKAPKEDKPTKFLVTMKKSLRKSIKKEAAEVGVSMNEYILNAVVEKLGLEK
ncbi:MAG: hypothetical protein WCP20_00420 [Desulfuromonadales bacterium]